MAYHMIQRVVSEYPLGVELPSGAPVPVRARDDLDPHAPPLEYADGMILWSGHATREDRERARADEMTAEMAASEAAAALAAERLRDQARRALARIEACEEHRVQSTGPAWCYISPVAVHPYSEENRAAHGNVGYTDTCRCGAERARLVNWVHEEVSPWGAPDSVVRAADRSE